MISALHLAQKVVAHERRQIVESGPAYQALRHPERALYQKLLKASLLAEKGAVLRNR